MVRHVYSHYNFVWGWRHFILICYYLFLLNFQYEGLWHLIQTYPSEFQSGDCNDATYTVQSDGTVLVFNTQVIDQSLDTITGSAVLASNDSSAKLKVTFPTGKVFFYIGPNIRIAKQFSNKLLWICLSADNRSKYKYFQSGQFKCVSWSEVDKSNNRSMILIKNLPWFST